MRLRLGSLFVTLLALPALGQDAAQSEPVLLRWRVPAGEALDYRFDHEQTMGINKAQQGGSERRSRKTEFTLTRRSEPAVEVEGDQRVELNLTRLRERIKSPQGQELILDTGGPDQPGNWDEGAQLQHPIEFLLSERGLVRKVVRFGETVVASLPADQRQNLEEVLGDGILKNMVFSLLGELPAEPVSPGATWHSTLVLEVPTLSPREMLVTNTLHKVRNTQGVWLAVIVQEAKSSPDLAALGLQEWSLRGEIEFDIEAGRLHSTQVVTRLVAARDDSLVEIDTAYRLRFGKE